MPFKFVYDNKAIVMLFTSEISDVVVYDDFKKKINLFMVYFCLLCYYVFLSKNLFSV